MAYGDLKVRNLIWNTGSGDNTVVLSTLATTSSPTFTGTVTVPTPSADDNSTKAASTAYVQTELGDYALKAGPTFTGTVTGVNLTLSGNLTVNGTQTIINTQTLDVEDKQIEIGKVSSPSDTTADQGGWKLKGASDKTFLWVNATDAWTSSEHIHLGDNKKLLAGTGSDLQIWHTGSESVIRNTTSGHLYIQNSGGNIDLQAEDNIFLKNYDGQTYARFMEDGASELYFDDAKKLETTSGGINVTGAINVNGAALSTAPTITANADGSISANDGVVMQSDGTVKKIEQITTAANYSYSSTVGLNTQDSESYTVCADPHNSNRWAVAYKDDDGAPNEGKIKIITRSGTSLTQSSWHVFHGNIGGNITMCFDPAASGRIVIFYRNANESNNYYSRLVTFTGSAGSESFTNNSELETVGNNGVGFVIQQGFTNPQPVGTSGNFLIVWHRLTGGTGYIRAKMVHLSGTTLSTVDGNHVSITTLHEDTVEMAGWGVNPSGTQGFITIRNQYGKWALKPINFSGTGTSMTMSTGLAATARGEELLTQNISSDNQHLSLAYVDDTHFVVIAKGGSNNSYSLKSFLVKYVGTTYTKSSEENVPTNLTGTPGSENQSRYGTLSNNLTTDPYKIALFSLWNGSGTSSGYSDKGISNIATVDLDTMDLSWSNQARIDDCSNVMEYPYIAQQSGADQAVLFIYRDEGDDYMDGRLYLTGSVASNLSTSFIGFSSAAYTNGQSATINVIGNTTTKSSLTPGTDYYVTKTGALATTADTPSVKAGTAISSTSLLIKGH